MSTSASIGLVHQSTQCVAALLILILVIPSVIRTLDISATTMTQLSILRAGLALNIMIPPGHAEVHSALLTLMISILMLSAAIVGSTRGLKLLF